MVELPPASGFVAETRGTIVLLRARFLEDAGPVTAAFSTRRGGTSPAPYDSLNLGLAVGDDPGLVWSNRRRFVHTLGYTLADAVTASQVHGRRVATAETDVLRPRPVGFVGEADGLITRATGRLLITFHADCVPVFLYDPAHHAGGLVHAGWRGTVQQIAGGAVRELAARFGTDPGNLRAVVGPAIGPCCYEVGEEVAGALESAFPHAGGVVRRDGDRILADLWQANKAGLKAAGVPETQIAVSKLCTACRRDLFFSHRAEQGRTGRMAAAFALK